MRILHICPLYFPSIGGNQLHNQLMAEELVVLGEEVHVFTANSLHASQFKRPSSSPFTLAQSELIHGVNIRRFKVSARLCQFLVRLDTIRGCYRLKRMIFGNVIDHIQHGPLIFGMLEEIKQLRPDIVMVNNNYAYTMYLGYLARRKLNCPFVVMPTMHMGDPWTQAPILKIIYQAADLLIACTEFEKSYLIKQGLAESKIVVLPLGIKLDSFLGQDSEGIKQKYKIKDTPIVGYIGRKVRGKGIEVLIDAMRIVWKQYPQAQLLLAGRRNKFFNPIMMRSLAQLSDQERNNVTNIDNFNDDEKKDFYAVTDIMVMASEIDAFGIAYLESWISGVPVIACKNTPQESIINDGENGLLVEYGNKEDLANAIMKLLGDSALRRHMGQKGKQAVEDKFNLNNYARQLQVCYHQVLNKVKKG